MRVSSRGFPRVFCLLSIHCQAYFISSPIRYLLHHISLNPDSSTKTPRLLFLSLTSDAHFTQKDRCICYSGAKIVKTGLWFLGSQLQGPCSWHKHVLTISRTKMVTQGHALSLVLPHAHKDVNRLSWGPGFPNNIKNAVPAFFTPRPYMKQNFSHFWVALTLWNVTIPLSFWFTLELESYLQ